MLDRTLFLAVSTWEGEVDSLSSNMLKGIAKLVVAYGDKLKDDQFIDRLGKVSVHEVIRIAKDRHAGTQGYAESLLLQYNKRLKYPLKWNSLNIKPSFGGDDMEFAESIPIVEEDGYVINRNTGEILSEPEDDDDDGDDDAIPDNGDALPGTDLMDSFAI